jgi:hypothetical protein
MGTRLLACPERDNSIAPAARSSNSLYGIAKIRVKVAVRAVVDRIGILNLTV